MKSKEKQKPNLSTSSIERSWIINPKLTVQKPQTIYLIQQRQLKKQSQAIGRRCIQSTLLQTYHRRMGLQSAEKSTGIAPTKQNTSTKSASNTNLMLGYITILHERIIVNLKEEVKCLKE